MHILSTSTEEQSLSVTARKDAVSPVIVLTDKEKNSTSTISVTKTASEPYMVLSGTFSLVEGRNYSFLVKDGLEVIYRGLIFCTDQTELEKYDVNKDTYVTEESYDNGYIIL